MSIRQPVAVAVRAQNGKKPDQTGLQNTNHRYLYPYHMDTIPISVPKAKPIETHTHWPQVQVWTDMGTDRSKNTHRLPMSNTTTT